MHSKRRVVQCKADKVGQSGLTNTSNINLQQAKFSMLYKAKLTTVQLTTTNLIEQSYISKNYCNLPKLQHNYALNYM